MLSFNKFICFSLLGRRIICKKNSLIQESSNNKMEILTDARHGWRKNAQQTDVVCLGNKNKKVVAYDVVTSVDDVCTQRHELLQAQRGYMRSSTSKGL